MRNILEASHLVISIILVGVILLQAKGHGFGNSSNSVSFTRRGAEKLVFRLTFVLAALFVVLSLLLIFV